jgi:hypothetical protein
MTTNYVPVGPVAALVLPKANLALIALAKAIHDAMLDNPSFPSPNPPLAVLAADIAALYDAEVKAGTRAQGAASFRDAKLKKVKEDLFHIRDYVQSVVEANMSPTEATAVIKSAFMHVRKPRQRTTAELSAKNTGVSGKVQLAAKAVARTALYSWEYSVDPSSWTSVPDTLTSRTEISGLRSACVYSFRFRAFTRAGQGDYSQVVSLIVH